MNHYNEDFNYDPDFQAIRASAWKNAIEISPYVKYTTLGPNSTLTDGQYPQENPEIIITNGNNGTSSLPASSDLNTSDYSYEKLIHEYQIKQKETTELVFKKMIGKMVAKRAEFMTNFVNQQEVDYQRRAKERRDREIEILHEWELDNQSSQLEMEKLDEQNKAHLQRMKKSLEKQLEQVNMMETLNNNHLNIIKLIAEIKNIPYENKDVFETVSKAHDSNLQSLQSSIDILMEKCKSGIIVSEDVEKSSLIHSQISKLKDAIVNEIELQEREAILKLEQKAKAESKAATEEEKVVPVQTLKKPKFVSEASYSLYEETSSFLESFERGIQPLLDDPRLKTFRFDCQKAVNTPVNAISSVSGPHIRDKYEKLFKLLKGDYVSVGTANISTSQHPLGNAYCMNLLAKKIVRQGDSAVSSNPEAAFPIASVTIALWSQFPDFGKLLMGHFYRECPYLVPMLIPQYEGQSDEEYYKSRGYIYNEDRTVEKQDKFLKRMSGIFRLMASIWVAQMPRCVNAPHPQGLSHAWRWMADFLNLDPERDISATLMFDFLTVCGEDFLKYYNVQFLKITQFLATDYTQMLDKIDEGGPKTRLTVFIQKIFRERKIGPPSGKLQDFLW